MRSTSRLLLALVLAFVAGSSRLDPSDEMPIAADLQAALFKKIFEYDRELNAVDVSVLVVHDGSRFETAERLVEAFRDTGLTAVSIPATELADQMTDRTVVYVTEGLDNEAISELCAARGVLSVSGLPELAEAGTVSVGIGVHEQKPQILVHLERLGKEGHRLAAELLDLARVIR